MRTREKVYNYILDFYKRNGYAPTIREIGEALGLASSSTVHGHVGNLIKEGRLHKKDSSPRTLVSFDKISENGPGSIVEARILKFDNTGTIEELVVGSKKYRVVEVAL